MWLAVQANHKRGLLLIINARINWLKQNETFKDYNDQI